jgi:hypothetical protein
VIHLTKARLIYLLVVASLLAYFLASVLRFPAAHIAGMSGGDSGFANGDS